MEDGLAHQRFSELPRPYLIANHNHTGYNPSVASEKRSAISIQHSAPTAESEASLRDG